jgi:adenylosuccinate lyase
MSRLFSPAHRVRLWRRLWLALAQAQQKVGLEITATQIAQLRRAVDDVNFAAAARYEKQTRHDVMAHLRAFADQAPAARPILHLGATSAYVVDNADLIIMRDALKSIAEWLAAVIHQLGRFAKTHRSRPTLGFTHYQPAQLTTVGKRAATWCWDFVRDLEEIETRLDRLRFRGVKGATGTQASFLALFDGNQTKVRRLEKMVAAAFGFKQCEPVTGQTYPRKVDAQVVWALAGVAASVHKFANDVRLLSNLKEIEEPFETGQVGSSAMAYKRNPMRMERATGLARFVLSLATSPPMTAAEQWFERTLDDSANRRLSIPECFLACDGMLRIVHNVASGLVVYPRVIEQRIKTELPFIATENILMAASRGGGDRQDLHERIRRYSYETAVDIKRDGQPNRLIERLRADDAFAGVNFDKVLNPRGYVGRAPEQVDEFLREFVTPIRRRYPQARRRDSTLLV